MPGSGRGQRRDVAAPGRTEWLEAAISSRSVEAATTTTPIQDLALLSDRHSAALVDRDGTIQWLAFPRFDSASVFGRLLGEAAGSWRVGPTSGAQVERRYLDGTLVL